MGARALNPFALSGLVFAGANRPDTPGQGILTAESIVGLDLSGMDLAVLSACETGLGDVAGGERVFGLQKAFHVAGCRNVVASLWKVDDDATTALMSIFYWHLLMDGLPVAESLRKTQLSLSRKPNLAKNLPLLRTPQFDESDLPAASNRFEDGVATAPTEMWAAFTLSGVGL